MKRLSFKIRKIFPKDFSLAMEILDNELGKKRVRSSDFLKEKFKEFPEYFIGAYSGATLIGIVCGFPREDYLLISEIAVEKRFQRVGIGKRLIREFEKIGFKKYKKISVGAMDNTIGFYKSLNYELFLLVQFDKGVYSKKDFSNFKILNIKDYGLELKSESCNLEELKKLRKDYPKSFVQYIFTKSR